DADGGGIEVRIAGIEPVDVGEQHEEVGIHRDGDPRREPVVVAERLDAPRRAGVLDPGGVPVFDELADGDAVVLVEDRHGAELEQARQRGAQAQRVVAVAEVALGEEHLRRGQPELRERRGVERDEVALTHGGAGLTHPQARGALAQSELAHAEPHRAARDHEHFFALFAELRELFDESVQATEREADAVVRDDAGAEFDDDATGLRQAAAIGGGVHGSQPSGSWTCVAPWRRPRMRETRAARVASARMVGTNSTRPGPWRRTPPRSQSRVIDRSAPWW